MLSRKIRSARASSLRRGVGQCRKRRPKSYRSKFVSLPVRIQSRRLLWPDVLADCHLTKSELNKLVWEMKKTGKVIVEDTTKRQRTPQDEQFIALGSSER